MSEEKRLTMEEVTRHATECKNAMVHAALKYLEERGIKRAGPLVLMVAARTLHEGCIEAQEKALNAMRDGQARNN